LLRVVAVWVRQPALETLAIRSPLWLAAAAMPNTAVAHETHAHWIPSGLTATEAAAVPETFFTVWHNVFERGGLKAGETLLVHGGSSGIGTVAIQLAKAFGARVITTAGSAEKCDACRRLGADVAVNYKTEDFVPLTKSATGGAGAEVILDMVGGDYIERNYEAAAVEGRIVQIAFQGSPRASVDFRRIMLKRLHHTGSTLRSRSVPDKAAIAQAIERNVGRLSRPAGPVRTTPSIPGCQGTCTDGIERPYREDRARHVSDIGVHFRYHGGMMPRRFTHMGNVL
jgi:NADPH:quinone reductase-like Zn-dependent oxidoreductase